jgi:hypothetical protein
MEVRELGHRTGEIVGAERHSSTGEAKLDFDVAGREYHTIAEHRASLPGQEPTMCEPRPPCHGRGDVTVESLHADGRGVAYTRSPFAYLFDRVA